MLKSEPETQKSMGLPSPAGSTIWLPEMAYRSLPLFVETATSAQSQLPAVTAQLTDLKLLLDFKLLSMELQVDELTLDTGLPDMADMHAGEMWALPFTVSVML